MASKMMKTDGVGDWSPPVPSGDYMKLLEPTAKDNPDALNGTNELKNMVGKAMGKPSDSDLGPRGRNF